MIQPKEFYTNQLEILTKEEAQIAKNILQIRLLRLIAFLATAFGVYITFYKGILPIAIGVIGFCFFVFLVLKFQKQEQLRALVKSKKAINTTELNVLNRTFTDLPTGEEFADATHFYSHDIDLFGQGSFFQYLNRTVTQEGKQLLASLLTENSIERIIEKQKALKELAAKTLWRQHFSAVANSIQLKSNITTIKKWIGNYTTQFSEFLQRVAIGFSVISIVLISLVSLGFVPFSVLTIWFFIGLGVTGKQLKKTQTLYTQANNAKAIFKQYYLLLEQLENESFESEILKEKQAKITNEGKKASTIFKEFSKILDTFDQRNNIVIAVFGNGLFLWDILNAVKTEKWLSKHKEVSQQWFDVVSFFDAQNALANYVFNHPEYTFPQLNNMNAVVESTGLGHPLLDAAKRVDNDFIINNEQFFIVTGANMAGKSTFLRTVSLAVVMANCGLPVCAEEFKYTPVKLITSMRTSDSLTDDESYFYSELKRLKFIVDKIKSDTYFIILDEILKGTNSKDKAEGSKKFVEKLNQSNSTGIIATHDVSLCELANEYTSIKNYYFDAEIINNELFFDYTMKNGVCKNMNASFLLKKMEIV